VEQRPAQRPLIVATARIQRVPAATGRGASVCAGRARRALPARAAHRASAEGLRTGASQRRIPALPSRGSADSNRHNDSYGPTNADPHDPTRTELYAIAT